MTLLEMLEDYGYDGTVVFSDPAYDDAFVGVTEDGRAVYLYDKMIECLMRDDGMEYDEAAEFIDYNAVRALPYCGEKAPLIIYALEDME